MAQHVVQLTINNDTGKELTYQSDWFDSGGLSGNSQFPKSIGATPITVKMQKTSGPKGCSGYVNYLIDGKTITFAFSNPSVGTNKLGVGNNGKGVWDDMGSHDYEPFSERFEIDNAICVADCICTGGDLNQANVTLTFA